MILRNIKRQIVHNGFERYQMSIIRMWPMVTHNKRFLTRIQRTTASTQFYITSYGVESNESETCIIRTEMGRVSTW